MITLASTTLGTTLPVEGRLRNLNLQQAGLDGLQATYEHEGGTDAHDVTMYVNGSIGAISTTDTALTPALGDGIANANVIPHIITDTRPLTFFDEADGGRVLLQWAPSDDAAAYRVYSYPDNTLLATITSRQITPKYRVPVSGTGTGRITVPAVFAPATLNGLLTMTIQADNSCTFVLAGAAEVGTHDFWRGATVYYQNAIPFLFEDEPESYAPGDVYQVYLGTQTRWLSPQLDPGEYQYAITAVDASGQESAAAVTRVYEIVDVPATVDTVTETYADNTLSLAFDMPAGADSVNIYTNFLPQESAFDPYIGLLPAGNATDGTYTIPFNGATGTLQYYLWPVADGVIYQDFTVHTIAIPYVGGLVTAPYNLTAEPVGALNWEISWDYYFEPDDALLQFTMHRSASATPPLDETDLVTTVSASAIGENYEESFTYTHTTETLPAGDYYLQIVAHSTGGATAASAIIPITTIPLHTVAAPGSIIGGTV